MGGSIDPRLARLIREYQNHVALAVEMLACAGVARPASNTAWVETTVPTGTTLPGGFGFHKHGFGCAVGGPDWGVDFDFGDRGQIDGFDPWRLCSFARNRLQDYGFASEEEVKMAVKEAADAGDLTFSGYILYYVT